jgi:hypothetical protein
VVAASDSDVNNSISSSTSAQEAQEDVDNSEEEELRMLREQNMKISARLVPVPVLSMIASF